MSVIEPKSWSHVVWGTFGRCSASLTGISLVQIDPAAALRCVSLHTVPTKNRKRAGKGLTNGTTHRTADLGPEEDHRGRDGHVDVGHGGLRGDGRGDRREPAPEALEELCPDDLRVGGVCTARVDHQADTPMHVDPG